MPLAIVLAVGFVGQQPAAAVAEPQWTAPAPKDVAGVRVVDAKAPAAPAAFSAQSRAVRGARPVVWPTAGAATVDLATAREAALGAETPARVRAGNLPVTLKAAGVAPAAVSVTVHDRAATAKAGVDGLLLSVTRADGKTTASKTGMEVDYSGFADAFGGDWASRLRLVQRPACALSTPELAQCQTATPVATKNNAAAQTLEASVAVSNGITLLAAEGGPSGDNGDYTASSLSPAGSWQVSAQTGDFSWSQKLRTPPALGGPAPAIALGYSSGSIDGRTATSNNQGSWIGDGWDFWPGFIERRYESCSDDNLAHKTGDQCWYGDNATLSMNGHSGDLIKSGSVWKLKNDDGTKVEKLTDAARGNGDNDNEYWKVTTTDGTQYFFGYHKLPGWSSGNAVTDSTWTVPVFGNNSGEPCYDSTFANAYCSQGWRWNLDYVVDPNSNSMGYFYGKETGAYGRDNTPSQRTTYIRGGYLDRIEYGMRAGSEFSQAAPVRVKFDTAERCLSGCWTGVAWTSDPVTSAWADTPWDQYCKASPCNEQGTPTFWSARRLTKVTTQTRNGTSSYRDVESWTLRHEFINAGTGEGTPMWLRGITRTGHVITAGGAQASDPEITFDSGAEPLPNRVDNPNDSRTALNRWRIKAIHNESGGDVLVTYSGNDCATLPNPATNTKRCMPSFYSPAGTPTLDWFHKYVVTRIDLDDTVTDQPTESTFYDYLDTPAWHYNTDEVTKDKYRTWGDWRGYGRVQIRHGDPTGQQKAVEYRYLRGMDGDKATSGTKDVWVTDSWGGTVEDHESLRGFVLQEITYNGPGGAEVSSNLNVPWKSGPTATRTRNGVTTEAWITNTGTVRSREALAAGGFRTTKKVVSFNSDGLPVSEDDLGVEGTSGDEVCTRTTYARNDTIWMIDRVSQTEKLSVTCVGAPTPATPSTVLSRERTFYDTYVNDSSFGAAPTRGNAVRTEDLGSWSGSTPQYVRTATSVYDSNGRATSTTDPRGYTTTTAFTTANGGLVTQTLVTNALGHQTTTLKEPAWDSPTKVTDANGIVIDQAYDGLGRLKAVWLPGRNSATQTASIKFSYLMRNAGGPTAVTTDTLLPTGAGYKTAVNLLDGWLRQRQKQVQATGGGRILAETFHNTLGQVAWTSAGYHDTTNTAVGTTLGTPQGQIPSITQSQYDGAGRKTAEIFLANGVEDWRTTTAYGGERTSVTPPEGGIATTTITDANGKTVELRQYKVAADVGSDDPAKFDRTLYTHTLLGEPKTVTDAAGNAWSYSYDLRGRKTQSVDPDRGTVDTTFDAAGNVITATAPLGTSTATVAYTYDELGRKSTVRDDSVTGTIRAAWVYDTLPYGKGKTTSSTRYVGGNAYVSRTDSFDVYGRPTSTSVVLPASESGLCAAAAPNSCTYTTLTSFKPNGQPFQITMPAAADLASEKLTHGYTDVGEEGSLLSAAQIYVDSVVYNKLGMLTQRQLGAYGSRVALNSTFDEPTGRLVSANVLPESKPEAANYAYTYDDAGNVKKISEAPTGGTADHQCYQYDYLRRMTEAWTPTGSTCNAVAPTAWSSVGGPTPYWYSWTMDAVGNRLTETRHATTNTTYAYSYPSPGSARPHAVTNVAASGATTWSRNYTYDNGGNAKTRPNSAGVAQTLTYDREGHLETLVQGSTTTSFVYDVDGKRLIRADGTGKTLYLPNGLEVRSEGTVKTATRYYTHRGNTIAVRTGTGLHWIAGDRHGTAELTISASTLSVAKRRTLPYGEQRGTTSGTWAAGMDKGFVGGTKDPTGLTHLGAREYDPFIGKFLSVDPEIDSADPQQLNAYAYSNNSPPTMSDSDGLRFCEDDCSTVRAKPKGPSISACNGSCGRKPTRQQTLNSINAGALEYVYNPALDGLQGAGRATKLASRWMRWGMGGWQAVGDIFGNDQSTAAKAMSQLRGTGRMATSLKTMSAIGKSPLVKRLGPAGAIAGGVFGAIEDIENGEDPVEASVKAAFEVAGGIAGGAIGASVGTALCGGFVLCGVAGGMIGSYLGGKAGAFVGEKAIDTYKAVSAKLEAPVTKAVDTVKSWFGW